MAPSLGDNTLAEGDDGDIATGIEFHGLRD